ncbi:MAG: phytanoyl-CoA dioxygenase family protein [Fuerstiella sp.]|jgi:ectoine hydroxylase-related dioxygenase (phytanoyl-CoA dioxygenase family)
MAHTPADVRTSDFAGSVATAASLNVEQHGFAIVPDVLDAATVAELCRVVTAARERENSENVSNASGTYGLRNLTDVVPKIADLVRHPRVVELVSGVLGCGAFMVRATLFDKTDGANWGVFWHQDLSIAVHQRCEVDGFGAWTRKAGVQCVQPPTQLMQNVLAVRLHLDDCSAENGALKVLPGTHRLEKLATADIETQQMENREVTCEVPSGGAVLMRPLLLHASSPMLKPGSRRVIHFEFANFDLPEPLQWMYRIACQPEAANSSG